MGYDIYLIYKKGFEWWGEIAKVPKHYAGGIIVLGGDDRATISVTYNYAPFFHQHLDKKKGIRWLYGKRAGKTIKRLRKAVDKLGTERSGDYWEPTPGNAGYILYILWLWAIQHPNAIWTGD